EVEIGRDPLERGERPLDVGELPVAKGVLERHLNRVPEDADLALDGVRQILALLVELPRAVDARDQDGHRADPEGHLGRNPHLPNLPLRTNGWGRGCTECGENAKRRCVRPPRGRARTPRPRTSSTPPPAPARALQTSCTT